MTERFYQIAGVSIRVVAPTGWLSENQGALTPFAVEPGGEISHTMTFEPVERLSDPEGECVFREPAKRVYRAENAQIRYVGSVEHSLDGAYLRILREDDRSFIQVERQRLPQGITAKVILNSMEAEHLITRSRGILLHASYIRRDGRAILFTAPSGTGKSTQADLWCRHRGAELLNGDRAVIRVVDNEAFACGVPFSGSSGVSINATMPLAAIVYLSQAPETTVCRLRGLQAFRKIWEGCSLNVWDSEDVAHASQTALDIVGTVPVYHLACTPDLAAVQALEAALAKGDG